MHDPHDSPEGIAPGTSATTATECTKHLRLVREPDLDIIEPEDFGVGKRYATRRAVFEKMEIGDVRSFGAKTKVQYDPLRGSIYGYAKKSGKKFTASRSNGIVTVERKPDDYVPVPLVLG